MRKYWVIAPYDWRDRKVWERVWDYDLTNNVISVGWGINENPSVYDETRLRKLLRKYYSDRSERSIGIIFRIVWRFYHEVKPGDIVIARRGLKTIAAVGTVKHKAYYDRKKVGETPVDNSFENFLDVDWHGEFKELTLDHSMFAIPTLLPINRQKVSQIKQAYLKKYPKLKEALAQLLDGVSADAPNDCTTKELLVSAEQRLTEEHAFDPAGIKDARQRIASAIVQRRGQTAFRNRLLVAYKRRCAITGYEAEAVLEAVHIVPYMGSETNHLGNGLLLRGDLHTLFDLGLVAVDAKMRLLVSRKLAGTPYDDYRGKQIMIPDNPACQPSQDALEKHRRKSAFVAGARRRTRRCT